MDDQGRALEVIDALYEASLDASRWRDALARLMAFTGSQGATFWVLDGSEQPRLPTLEYLGFDPAFMREYLERVVPDDPYVQYLVAHPGEPVVHDGLVITDRDKDRHAYFDWHGRHSETRYRLIGRARPAPDVQAGVALHRTRRMGRFEEADVARFGALHRHLARALSLGAKLGALEAWRACAAEALERSPGAVILLDEACRVVHLNGRAEALCAARDGLEVARGRVQLARPLDQDTFERLVANALASRSVPGATPGGSMLAARPSGRQAYGVLVSPLPWRSMDPGFRVPAVCLAITDPCATTGPAPRRLQRAFGLTAAEARLAALLAAGIPLRGAASRLDITYGTARARLQQVFRKVGVRRQAELVGRLVASGGSQ